MWFRTTARIKCKVRVWIRIRVRDRVSIRVWVRIGLGLRLCTRLGFELELGYVYWLGQVLGLVLGQGLLLHLRLELI